MELVKLGDPDAVTTRGQETVGGEPRIGGEPRELLLRVGFVKVDRTGLLRPDAYVAADQIDRVEGDIVHLSVTDQNLLSDET